MKNPIDASAVISEVMPQVHEALVQRVVSALAEDVYEAARKQIGAEIEGFIDAEITPALKAALQEKREEIVASLAAEVGKVGELLAGKMAEGAAKKLSDDYRFRNLMKELFGGY